MANKKELEKEEKELEEAEVQLTKRDLILERGMRELARKGFDQAKDFMIEEAYQTLEELRRLMPALVQDARAEWKEEAEIGKVESEEKGERKQEKKLESGEGKLDRGEIKVLGKVYSGLFEMVNMIDKQGVQKSKNKLIEKIKEIKGGIAALLKLERLEISEELREDVIEGTTTDKVRNLIKDEKNALSLLNTLITKIEELINENGHPLTIVSHINNTIIIVKKLIAINKAELGDTFKK